MSSYAYEAVNATGASSAGVIDVDNQNEAVRRIREMGLFPIRVAERQQSRIERSIARTCARSRGQGLATELFQARVKSAAITVLTRQMATLVEAGLPMLRGLKILEQQEGNRRLKRILAEVAASIEGGSQLSEALAHHPKIFNRLYINMVRAGEVGGALEITLKRLAEFMEKAQKIKGKVKSAMYYPCAVMFVATAIVGVMLVFVIPRFKTVFDGLLGGTPMPPFTTFILNLSDFARNHFVLALLSTVAIGIGFTFALKTEIGRLAFDQFKLKSPVFGSLFRKLAISRFARTLGTLLGSGVPVLQALTIARETAGNVVVARLISSVHDGVKEGENITTPLRASSVFPPMVVGMVDVGEQTGALPDMLMKIADGCDEEVDNAVSAMTSLLEPILILFLAVVVGSIVIAMVWPLVILMNGNFGQPGSTDSDP
jgi:type IV pilus assembly protein PilC